MKCILFLLCYFVLSLIYNNYVFLFVVSQLSFYNVKKIQTKFKKAESEAEKSYLQGAHSSAAGAELWVLLMILPLELADLGQVQLVI